ncbi:MAG: hypothetical protein ACW98X_26655 [Promethearchaeota archaeon]|jgi:hypothetical protein
MSWILQKKKFLKVAKNIDSSIILTTKDNWFWWLASFVAYAFSLGKTSRKRFLTGTASGVGPVIGIPKEYSTSKALDVIRHEGRHVLQFRLFGFWLPKIGPYIGMLPMAVLYGLLLPIGFNWFRYRFELDAQAYNWRCRLTNGWSHDELRASCIRSAKSVSSWLYGKPIWFSWAKWGYLRKLNKVIKKQEKETGKLYGC